MQIVPDNNPSCIQYRYTETVRAISLYLAVVSTVAAQTYSHDIRPIVAEHCASCHSAGEIGPMPLTTYTEVRPWAAAIREAVSRGIMPPWHAAPGHAYPFRNDRSLTPKQIDAIKSWASKGAPEGEPTAPILLPATNASWKLGRPDVVIQVPGFPIPKEGPLPYSFLITALHFDHDTWIRAAEFRIDQRQAIHHMNAFVRPPGSSYLDGFPRDKIFVATAAERGKRKTDEPFFARREMLLGYEPGYQPMPWLPDGAKLIPAGSDVIFEMHYNPNGKPAVDHSEFGLYIAKSEPRYRVLSIDTLRDIDLAIPPDLAAYRSDASMTLAQPARLLSLQPHMHVRGASMKVDAVYPGGRSEVLLDVPHYDCNWQTTYVLAQPADLPKGTRLLSVATYDNTANNAFNPNPRATVRWGDQTTDEMHIAFLDLVVERTANPNSLFQAAPKMIGTPATSGTR